MSRIVSISPGTVDDRRPPIDHERRFTDGLDTVDQRAGHGRSNGPITPRGPKRPYLRPRHQRFDLAEHFVDAVRLRIPLPGGWRGSTPEPGSGRKAGAVRGTAIAGASDHGSSVGPG